MKSGKQRYIKWILWGLFIALNVVPLFFPNESIMWTLRAIGYQVEGFEIKGISEIKIGHFADDTKDRFLDLKNLELHISRDDMGFAVELSIADLKYKDRHLPNYKLKNLLQGLSSINTLSMGPGLSILELKIEHLSVEFSESSAPFKIDNLRATNIRGEDGLIIIGALQADGPNIRYSGDKLNISASPDQFADIETPITIETDLNTNPLRVGTGPLDDIIQKL